MRYGVRTGASLFWEGSVASGEAWGAERGGRMASPLHEAAWGVGQRATRASRAEGRSSRPLGKTGGR